MSYDELMNKRGLIENMPISDYIGTYLITIAIEFTIISVFILLIYYLGKRKEETLEENSTVMKEDIKEDQNNEVTSTGEPLVIIPLIFGIALIIVTFYIVRGTAINNSLTEWENKDVEAYIASLPSEKHNLIYIDNRYSTVENQELSSDFNVKSNYKYSPGYNEVTYDNNGTEVKKVVRAKLHFTLEDNETPYIEYKYLDRDITRDGIGMRGGYINGYIEGKYNTNIYLPKRMKDNKE